MVNELLCLTETSEGKKLSFSKLCCRFTYFALGSGSGVLTRYIMAKRKDK